mgnify:CR=1 FL=1|tara:strand:+ start:1138 stop:1392 length:255 start_codon:yes stop_codon:yes gene_type:complete
MHRRKLQAVINRIGDDVKALQNLLKSKYKKREELDNEELFDQYDQQVIDVEVYHIDLEIENINGCISAYDDSIGRLKMLKESIK